MKMKFTSFICLGLIISMLSMGALAQLTFSTGWGKRSVNPLNCRIDLNSLLFVSRHLQNELHKMIECAQPASVD